eukprot:1494860-Pyramimonas_sp.AAC.1
MQLRRARLGNALARDVDLYAVLVYCADHNVVTSALRLSPPKDARPVILRWGSLTPAIMRM